MVDSSIRIDDLLLVQRRVTLLESDSSCSLFDKSQDSVETENELIGSCYRSRGRVRPTMVI